MKYEIIGGNLPAVRCTLAPGETLITESGAMSWMSANMKMDTTTGGGIGKMFGRMVSGDTAFQNKYTAQGTQGEITLSSSFPGSIVAVEVCPGKDVIVQKSAFLACEESVSLSVHLQKKLGSGLFGGEGFIMQKLSGNGIAFIEIDGSAVEYNLEAGQQMIVDTGYLAMMESTCTMDIQTVGGVKNALFGGESLFNTVVTGPGKIVLQTMPVSAMAGILRPFIVIDNK